MAQDATGTPTALGIPKYNTAADAPSGRGFNAVVPFSQQYPRTVQEANAALAKASIVPPGDWWKDWL